MFVVEGRISCFRMSQGRIEKDERKGEGRKRVPFPQEG